MRNRVGVSSPKSGRAFGWWDLAVLCGSTLLSVASGAELTVTWDDNSTNETGFEIECAVDGGAFIKIADVPANITHYVHGNVAPSTSYMYRVRAVNDSAQSAYSNVASFTTSPDGNSGSGGLLFGAESSSRLTNLSARAIAGTGDRSLIVGFVVKNAGKSVLVRAIGPGLSALTSASTLSDPFLSIRQGAVSVMENDDWGGSATLKAAFSQLGAFPLNDQSKDAAVLGQFSAGGYTAVVTGAGTGLAMAEIYDADSSDHPNGKLVNISVRAETSVGDGVLIVGFVIEGTSPMRVLIRASGPSLSDLGVAGAVADPQLDVFRGNVRLDGNDNWGGRSDLKAAFNDAGAFAWPASSKDAALIAVLAPGAYTAIVSGVAGSTGVTMAEVYELR